MPQELNMQNIKLGDDVAINGNKYWFNVMCGGASVEAMKQHAHDVYNVTYYTIQGLDGKPVLIGTNKKSNDVKDND